MCYFLVYLIINNKMYKLQETNNNFRLINEKTFECIAFCIFTKIKRKGIFNKKTFTTIWDLLIIDEYRNMGLGKKFINEIINALKGRVDYIELQVKHENAIAIKLYKSFDFKIYKSTDFFFYMRKTL